MMEFAIPQEEKSIIKVIGVGGGGSNAVSFMYRQGIIGVDFAICNTDNQSLELSPVPTKIQLGPDLTEGRGAGSKPDVGKQACIESVEDVRSFLSDGTKMLFVTAGMGGGTGTGAAPIIAGLAREMNILTVGIVTLPFVFEGKRRSTFAVEGLAEMKANVDALIVISNDKLRDIHGNLMISEAFSKADNILTTAAKGIAEIITVPGYINVDFEDVNTVMRDSGVAIMGTSIAEGPNRAIDAVTSALNSPLLEDNDISGAEHILLNISSGSNEVTMDEISQITDYVQEKSGYGTDLIWGNCTDETLGEKISITVIATGFDNRKKSTRVVETNQKSIQLKLEEPAEPKSEEVIKVNLDEPVINTIEFESENFKINPQEQVSGKGDEPFVKKVEKAIEEEIRPRHDRVFRKRELNARPNLLKLNSLPAIMQLENVPAYERRGVVLEEVAHSSEFPQSRWMISNDDDTEIRRENRFLHDNVD